MSARDDYPLGYDPGAAIIVELDRDQYEQMCDEIDSLRQARDELLAQIVAMQTGDPQAIRTVVAGYWSTDTDAS